MDSVILISYKETEEPEYKWLQVNTSYHKWLRVRLQATKSAYDWIWVRLRVRTCDYEQLQNASDESDHERLQVTTSDYKSKKSETLMVLEWLVTLHTRN